MILFFLRPPLLSISDAFGSVVYSTFVYSRWFPWFTFSPANTSKAQIFCIYLPLLVIAMSTLWTHGPWQTEVSKSVLNFHSALLTYPSWYNCMSHDIFGIKVIDMMPLSFGSWSSWLGIMWTVSWILSRCDAVGSQTHSKPSLVLDFFVIISMSYHIDMNLMNPSHHILDEQWFYNRHLFIYLLLITFGPPIQHTNTRLHFYRYRHNYFIHVNSKHPCNMNQDYLSQVWDTVWNFSEIYLENHM